MPFYRVPVLGLKDSYLANDHQVGDRLVERYPGLIILMGPDFSEEYFSLMRRSCLLHHVSRWAVLAPLALATSVRSYPFSHLKWENSGMTCLDIIIAGDT